MPVQIDSTTKKVLVDSDTKKVLCCGPKSILLYCDTQYIQRAFCAMSNGFYTYAANRYSGDSSGLPEISPLSVPFNRWTSDFHLDAGNQLIALDGNIQAVPDTQQRFFKHLSVDVVGDVFCGNPHSSWPGDATGSIHYEFHRDPCADPVCGGSSDECSGTISCGPDRALWCNPPFDDCASDECDPFNLGADKHLVFSEEITLEEFFECTNASLPPYSNLWHCATIASGDCACNEAAGYLNDSSHGDSRAQDCICLASRAWLGGFDADYSVSNFQYKWKIPTGYPLLPGPDSGHQTMYWDVMKQFTTGLVTVTVLDETKSFTWDGTATETPVYEALAPTLEENSPPSGPPGYGHWRIAYRYLSLIRWTP